MISLEIRGTVGESLVGSATFGQRFPAVEIGKMAPMLRKAEDPDGLARAGFLDPSVPTEVNLISAPSIRTRMSNLSIAAPAHPDWLPPERMVGTRPSVGYVPPELMTEPSYEGLAAMARKPGTVSYAIASLRLKQPELLPTMLETLRTIGTAQRTMNALEKRGDIAGAERERDRLNSLRRQLRSIEIRSDAEFLVALSEVRRLYFSWLSELIATADFMGVQYVAPPVPVVTKSLTTSPQRQDDLNMAARTLWRQAAGLRTPRALYSLHLHPSALDDASIVNGAIASFHRVVVHQDNPYYGVHVHFTDIALAGRTGDRIRTAKEVVSRVAGIANGAGMFVWVSDTGAVGPVFLDRGASFASYHPGMTPRRAYTAGGADDEDDTHNYGKVLGLYTYELFDREQIRSRGWRVDDNGRFLREVPVELRADRIYKAYRVGFGKPNNVAVEEWVNEHRTREILENGNARAGSAQVARSNDPRISAWADI